MRNTVFHSTPLILGTAGVQIYTVLPPIKEFGVIVHIEGHPGDEENFNTKAELNRKVDAAIKYLNQEFCDKNNPIDKSWKQVVGIVWHNPPYEQASF